jgi:hypothetical protein
MDDASKQSLIGAGIQLGGAILGIAGKALAGLYRDPEEIRKEMLNTTGDFLSFIRSGGEMDQRAKAARDKTDAAIAEAEKRLAAGTVVVDADKLP